MNVSTSTVRVKEYLNSVDMSKPLLAFELHALKTNVYWKGTEYESWRGYCNVEVALSQASIYQYVRTAQLSIKYNYSLDDLLIITRSIGWSRLQLGLTKLDEVISVPAFILRFKELNLNERIVFEKDSSTLVSFSFSLPKAYGELLTQELVARGMRVDKSNRINASAAMIKLVQDVTASA